jgi:DNA-directed RNA polymerase subunit M/transcription elongation factor TFIIS
MIVFRGCVKCEGDLYVEQGIGDTDLVCLQCGYRRGVSAAELEREEREAAERERQLEPAGR